MTHPTSVAEAWDHITTVDPTPEQVLLMHRLEHDGYRVFFNDHTGHICVSATLPGDEDGQDFLLASFDIQQVA